MARPYNQFDPLKLARYEKDNYMAYYQRRWLKLLVVSVLMVKEAYQLSLWQAVRGAYLVARAEMAFAPHPNNNLPLAKAYIRRFYTLLARIHHWELPLETAVDYELNWWVVHRQLFADEHNQPLVDALAHLLILVYRIPHEAAQRAAEFRAQGMLLSDRWVRQGLDPRSPLLAREEELLCQGYTVLKSALGG